MTRKLSREDAEREARRQADQFLRRPKKPPRCVCTNHLGGPKQQFKTRDGAINAILKNHLWTGKGYAVYPCPTSDRFHVRSKR